MVDLIKVPVSWDGLPGLPGVSVFYRTGGAGLDLSSLKSFFTAIQGLVPNGMSWTIPSAGDTVDSATGALLGTWSATGAGTVASTAVAGGYPAGTGMRVRWLTNTIVGRRRLVGSTFICPLAPGTYEVNGTILPTPLSTLQSAANALTTSGVAWQVWHRPRSGSGGVVGAFSAAQVPDRVTSLRSRRT